MTADIVEPVAVVEPSTQEAIKTKLAEAKQNAELSVKEPSAEELKALEGLQELKDQGIAALNEKKFEEAVEKFSNATELLSNAYGALSPNCADVLLMYGRALYKCATNKAPAAESTETPAAETADVDADAAKVEETTSTDAAPAPAADVVEGAALEEIVGDDGKETEEEEEEEGEHVAEEKDDLQTAWEVLDTARIIFAKMENVNSQLAETHMLLGDVALESDNYESAVKDFGSGIELLEKAYPGNDRVFAQAHFQLAHALELASETAKAIEHLEKAVAVLKKCIAASKSEESKDADPKEMEELLSELEKKIEALKSASVKASSESENGVTDATVEELSVLVKSKKSEAFKFMEDKLAAQGVKRKAEESVENTEESKKVKETTV